MKPAAKRIATHAGAVLLGIALATAVLPAVSSSNSDDDAARAAARLAAEEAARNAKLSNSSGKSSSGGTGESRSAAFRAAWADLAKEPLNFKQRIAAQKRMLGEWALFDLDGALTAYLGEAWDERDPMYNGQDPLGVAFYQAFTQHPLESWKTLSGPRMGMARQLLAHMWARSVGDRDREMIISVLGELPDEVRQNALAIMFLSGDVGAAEKRPALLAKLTTTGTPQQQEQWLQEVYRAIPQTADPASLSAKWTGMPASGERTREMAAWASSQRRADPAALTAEWDKIPAADRGQAARMLLSQVDNESPALLDAIEKGIEAGEWSTLSQGVCDKLRGFETDRQALAEWALTLPEREETRFIFNLAISEKLIADPAAGRAWLEALPVGSWHREHGFIELMLGSVWVNDDPAAAQRAIDSITDPVAKQTAVTDFYNWQLITGQKKIKR
ncbi:hypothetical protein [Luteolibacter sp. Populi]|uniref:hypothetical protein n=1 Tax=Luteolibacter sp. Populi TaxID=3230487 RepID=UPI003466E99F